MLVGGVRDGEVVKMLSELENCRSLVWAQESVWEEEKERVTVAMLAARLMPQRIAGVVAPRVAAVLQLLTNSNVSSLRA